MLTFDELAQKSFKKEPLEDGVSLYDELAYLALSALYDAYRAGAITQEAATLRKAEVKEKYDKVALMIRAYEVGAKRQRAAETMIKEIQEHGCPLCQRMMAVMDGRERVE